MASPRRKPCVHQYHSGTAKGDAVTNGMFYARALLREMGFESEIFCSHPDPLLGAEVSHISRWDGLADALLVHHSMGIDDERWLTEVDCKKVLVYHNITPAEFFSSQPLLGEYAKRGIEQVQRWRPTFAAVVADSEQNKFDLAELGYPAADIDVLPLLADLDAMRRIVPSERVMQEHEKYFNVLFVGRLAENKCQHEIVRAYARTRTRGRQPSRLVLVGGTTSEEYVATVRAEADRLGIADEVVFMGKVSDEDLAAVYRAAGVFVCLSRHEGFGVPLVEAMLYDVPIVALAAAAVPWTVGRGGILFDRLDHDEIAVAIDFLAEDPLLRAKLAVQQRRELTRFDRATIGAQLAAMLAKIGLPVPQPIEARHAALGGWRVEGPFDSTYSLAILNRNLGRALARQNVDVEYKSTEGPGDFAPGAEFLRANADISARLADGSRPRPLVTMRNLYPPRCNGFEGAVNGFALYAWEESNFPHAWVDDFNRSLSYVTTTSEYVTRTLINSGVKVPIRTVGDGIDHFAQAKPEPLPFSLLDGFRFLHNSSCFPRKGVDVLLKAFAREFSGRSDVCLIIKTFPNPHNEIERQIEQLRAQFPALPPIQLIMDPLTDGQMKTLYTNCHALVAPSRGEGFGLPLAEAMLCGIPVVTTAHGGQRDFCTDETAWLVDYAFAYSQTHFGLAGSIWAEPDAASLATAMREVVDGDPRVRETRIARARELVSRRFSWDAVASRQIGAVTDIIEHASIAAGREMHIAWVSTWKTRCGIAAYSQYLTAHWDRGTFTVLADEQPGVMAEEKVVRCWRQGAADTGERILAEAARLAADAVVVQYNFGFFPLAALARIIDALADRGKIAVVVFHATKDVDKPDFKASLREIRDSLARCSRILVHSVVDCNYLKQMGLVDNVVLFPQGAPPSLLRPQGPGRDDRSFIVGTFGYALPHKGLREIIEACGILHGRSEGVALRMYNARYPLAESDEEIKACKALVEIHLSGADVVFDDAYRSEPQILQALAECDLVVFPYQRTDESSSAAVRMALASGVPLLCTPLPIFDDVAHAVDFSSGIAPADFAETIRRFRSSPRLRNNQLERREKWLSQIAWPVVAKRLKNMLFSLNMNREVS